MGSKKKQPPLPPAPAPAGLSERSQALWSAIVVAERIHSTGRLTALEQALRSLDRADECGRLLAEQGLTTTTKTTGAVHVNPLTRLEREHRQLFAKLWNLLHLHFDPYIDGRNTSIDFSEMEV